MIHVNMKYEAYHMNKNHAPKTQTLNFLSSPSNFYLKGTRALYVCGSYEFVVCMGWVSVREYSACLGVY